MRDIFYPRSVAVIGVSDRPTNLGRNIVKNMLEFGYQGILYAVGPNGGTVQTHRIFRAVGDIPDHVDLAVIFTPAATVPGVLEECGKKGIRRVVIESAGFREYTAAGKGLEEEIMRIAKHYRIRFIGPNCIGVINMENGLCVPFPLLNKNVRPGNVSIITQSGGIGMSVLNLMANEGLRLNKFVSVGNVLDTNAEDLLEYMIDDPGTEIIFIYLESMGDGRRLMQIARRSKKPIMIFKANIGTLGQNIAASHTASLTSDDRVVDAAFRQAGILRVHDATTLGNNMKVLRLPPMRGTKLAIISRSGGHAVIAADACELSGFDLAHFSDEFLRQIEQHFRASVIRLTNPLDLGDLFDLNVYAQILEQTLQAEDVDGVVFLQTALSEPENMICRSLLDRIIALTEQYKKPIAYYLSTTSQEINYLKTNYSYPIFTQVVETIRALEINQLYDRMAQELQALGDPPRFDVKKNQVSDMLKSAQSQGRDLLLGEALHALECYGIQTAAGREAANLEGAVAAAAEIGYPVVMKIISQDISHKSDAGGVILNLADDKALEKAYAGMMKKLAKDFPQAQLDGVLIQPMIAEGRELILGGRQDPQFGPVVLVGLGGIFVEILDEVAVRVAPITEREALEMIEELRGLKVLKGARGEKPSDIQAVVQALLRLSQLLVDHPDIKELDINPLRVFGEGEGCRALDARMILEKVA